jgi:nucleoside-diphosphate-sugar epimerase
LRFDPDIDRKRGRLADGACALVRADERRIVLVGARGWIGRATLALLHEALGPDLLAARVACFGSVAAGIVLDDGTIVPQRPLAELGNLAAVPSVLFHLAFLTKDKVAGMDPEAYARVNRALSRTVLEALDPIGVDRLFVASSGAAASAEDPAAAADVRLYSGLKRGDEDAFASWAMAAPDRRRAAIGRIYSVSGPYINKYETYALASFIRDALAGRPIEVRAPMRVLRSYVAVRELVSFVFAQLLAVEGEPVLHFDTGGKPLELADVAAGVAAFTDGAVVRRPVTDPVDNRYVGDEDGWRHHLARFGMAPVPLDEQIAETMAWFARAAAVARVRRTG